jgi:signal transduction histidine kinase
LVQPFHSRFQSYQQDLQVNCAPEVRSLNSDPSILQRILIELLNNACKYTMRKSVIELSVTAQECPFSQVPLVTFTLRNQAEIPIDALPHIFEKFYRVTQVDRYKHGGTGLGLALVKKLVEELGGNISADSQDGWTTFTMVIPSHPLDHRLSEPRPQTDTE